MKFLAERRGSTESESWFSKHPLPLFWSQARRSVVMLCGGMVRGGYCCLGLSISLFSLNDDFCSLVHWAVKHNNRRLLERWKFIVIFIVVAFWVIWWYPKSDHCDHSACPSLLTEYKVNPNSRSRAGQTPLHIAAIYGRSLSWLSIGANNGQAWHGGWNWGRRKNILTNWKAGDLQRLEEQVRSRC